MGFWPRISGNSTRVLFPVLMREEAMKFCSMIYNGTLVAIETQQEMDFLYVFMSCMRGES